MPLTKPEGVSERNFGHASSLLSTLRDATSVSWRDKLDGIDAMLNLAERSQAKVKSGILPEDALKTVAQLLMDAADRKALPLGAAITCVHLLLDEKSADAK